MKNRKTLKRKVAAVLIVALSCAVSWAGGGVQVQKGDSSSTAVRSTSVVGSVVVVTVSNSSRYQQVVTVEVVAVVNGAPAVGYETATVNARSDASVGVEFSGSVSQVVSVGLIDDSGPI